MQSRIEIEKEFIEKIQKHQGILHKICFVYAKNNSDNEDLYQEMILQLWKSYSLFREESKFSTWMYRVALNTVITMTKKASLFERNNSLSSEDFIREEFTDYSEDIKILYKAISNLSKVEKAIILLWLEEKSYKEITETMGVSEKNISVKLVRTKKKLAIMIEKLQ